MTITEAEVSNDGPLEPACEITDPDGNVFVQPFGNGQPYVGRDGYAVVSVRGYRRALGFQIVERD